jgi:hypothetical protein
MTEWPEFSREFVLLATCCRWPVDRDRVRAVAAGPIDWGAFVRIAHRHRVLAMTHHAASLAGLPMPADVTESLTSAAREIAWQNLAYARESVRLRDVFESAGIPILFLKGVVLAQAAYGTLTLKQGRDIDVVVRAADVPSAVRIMEAEGFASADSARRLSPAQIGALVSYGSQIEFTRNGGRIRVELHWHLAGNPHLLRGLDPFVRPMTVLVPGVGTLRTLPPDDLFAYLCVHGAGHFWSRLKWLADLDAGLAGMDGPGLERLYRHAERLGAGRCAGQALLLCHRLLGRVPPPALVHALAADRHVTRLVTTAVFRMNGADPSPGKPGHTMRTLRNMAEPFRLGRGLRFFVTQTRILLIGTADAIHWPLPPALAFLYPLLRGPLWLWRQAVRFRSAQPIETPHRR